MISQLTRVLAFILALLLLPVFSFAEETAAYTVEGIAYPYLQCMDDAEEPTESEMTLYFVNGGDIPYVKLSEYMAFLSGLYRDMKKGDVAFTITVSEQMPHLFSVSRPDNHSSMVFSTRRRTASSSPAAIS